MSGPAGRDLSAQLRISCSGDAIVITVHGVVDEAAVRTIDLAAGGAFVCAPSRVVVDLEGVAGFTGGGAIAFGVLQERLLANADCQIAYRAPTEPGQRLLLASYARRS